jgi:SAM-dependent methyltransferase
LSALGALKARREAFLDVHRDVDAWRSRWFSAATYALWRAARPPTVAASRGLVLDAGSGRGSWRGVIVAAGATYESIDLAPRGNDRPSWVGDIMDMPQVPALRYDTVVCHQVLEHLPRPWRAAAEFHRVLKHDGQLVVSVPHLSRRHELPHDYFRFTQEGLRALLVDAGFEAIEVRAVAGILSFLHHQFSCLVVSPLAAVPVVGALLCAANAPLSWLCAGFDGLLDRAGLAPTAVLATARRVSPAQTP